jgi:hypothetical protein
MDMVVIFKVPQISGYFLVIGVSPSILEGSLLRRVISVWCRQDLLLFLFNDVQRKKKGNVFVQRRFVLSTKSRIPPRRPSVFVFWINSAFSLSGLGLLVDFYAEWTS